MPDLSFQIEKAEPQRFTVAPTLLFKLRIANAVANETIHSVALRCQIQLEVTRRQYTAEDQEQLRDLFGETERWGQTLKTMLWTHASVVAPAFQDTAVVDVPVPCTFDFNVAATKYFHGLAEAMCRLNFLFSGTVFYADDSGALQVAPIPWDKEARFRLPVKVLARNDGYLLSQQRLALFAPRCFRAPVSIQGRARYSDLGAGVGEHASRA